MDSNHNKSESDAVTKMEEEFYLQVETETYLQDSVPPCRFFIQNALMLKWHSPSSPHASGDGGGGGGGEEELGEGRPHQQTPQQPYGGQCPVALEIVWYTHVKGA